MKELDNIRSSFLSGLNDVKNLDELNTLRMNYFGKNSELNSIMKLLKDMSPEDKKENEYDRK